MTTHEPLAPLHEAVLDPTMLDALFEDVRGCAELIEVLVKPAAHAHTPDTSHTLEQARQMLADGSAMGVQLRYHYQGAQWWDTLMPTPGGIRLVRIRHEFAQAARPTG